MVWYICNKNNINDMKYQDATCLVCGREFKVASYQIKHGKGKTCSVLCRNKYGNIIRNNSNHEAHGESGSKTTPLYRRWLNIKQRCTNEKSSHYLDYGGRGISMCKEWSDSFESFRDWANSSGYNESLEIDRINNDGDYSPNNCRWITHQENTQNRRSNFRFPSGKTYAEVSAELGISEGVLRSRISKGMDPHVAETRTKVNPSGNGINYYKRKIKIKL